MFLWFIALSVAGVFFVFRDPALDYRAVAVGSLLPDAFDLAVRRALGPAHSVVVAIGLLCGVMLATIGSRSTRRSLLAVTIGVFSHLVLDGAWTSTSSFWWPLAGNYASQSIPSISHGFAVGLVEEIAGAVCLRWLYLRFKLNNAENRERFVKTGRLDRALM